MPFLSKEEMREVIDAMKRVKIERAEAGRGTKAVEAPKPRKKTFQWTTLWGNRTFVSDKEARERNDETEMP